MQLSSDTIVGVVAVVVALPPVGVVLWKAYRQRRTRDYLPRYEHEQPNLRSTGGKQWKLCILLQASLTEARRNASTIICSADHHLPCPGAASLFKISAQQYRLFYTCGATHNLVKAKGTGD
jgi:hypothetical protein